MTFRQLIRSCVAENIKAFGISLHQAVFNSVVHHFHEVPCSGGATIKIALFGGAAELLPARSTGNLTRARRKRFEDRIKTLYGFFRPAEHHAVSALQSPDAAA